MVCVFVVERELNRTHKPEQEWSPELEYQLQHQARLSFWVCASPQHPEMTEHNTHVCTCTKINEKLIIVHFNEGIRMS